jgi:hypothetical protein
LSLRIFVVLLLTPISLAAYGQQYTSRQIWPPADERQKLKKQPVESDFDLRMRLIRERDAKAAADEARRKQQQYDALHNPPKPPPIKLWDNTKSKWIYPGSPALNPFGLK